MTRWDNDDGMGFTGPPWIMPAEPDWPRNAIMALGAVLIGLAGLGGYVGRLPLLAALALGGLGALVAWATGRP